MKGAHLRPQHDPTHHAANHQEQLLKPWVLKNLEDPKVVAHQGQHGGKHQQCTNYGKGRNHDG